MNSTELFEAGRHAVRAQDDMNRLIDNVSTDAKAHGLALDASAALTQLIEYLDELRQEKN